MSHLVAVVLAAGASTRMGAPKAMLQAPDGRPFVARIVRSFASAGLGDVTVVTGSQHDPIVNALAADAPPCQVRVVRNPDPARGQLSSLWTALDALDHAVPDAIVVTLVDVPLVTPDTIQAVTEAWRRTGAPIVRPAVGDRHGHPVLFARSLFPELRRAPLDVGAKAVLQAHAQQVVNVAVHDEGAVIDIDTPSDYADVVGRARNS